MGENPPLCEPLGDNSRLLRSRDFGSLASADGSHRAKGLWAIDTANPNTWATALEYLRGSATDACLVQETKVRKAVCPQAEQTARNAGWNTALQACAVG